MKITEQPFSEIELTDYTESWLKGRGDSSDSELETLQYFMGRMVNLLAEKGLLDEGDVDSLFYYPGIKFSLPEDEY